MTPAVVGRRVLGLVGVLAALYGGAVLTGEGQVVDASAFTGVARFDTVGVDPAGALREVAPLLALVVVVVMAVAALRRGRSRDVAAAVVIVGASFVAARALKAVLDRPYLGDNGYLDNTFPSGHAAGLTALLVAAVVLAPPSARTARLSVVLATVAAVGGYASVVSYAHRPSDVVGAVLVVAVVATVTVAVFGVDGPRGWPAWSWTAVGVAALVCLALLGVEQTMEPGVFDDVLQNIALSASVWLACLTCFLTTSPREREGVVSGQR
ncbi:phosphatase PAP2 family protein [Mumia sp. DW29H23]|uniref:phosphatase PAP2 family protein n=1 Tax=Mumia sp. DW29H23 TaxID=3421241 RepID=UPI003D6968D5